MSLVFCSQPFALEVPGTRCPDLPNYTLTSDACKSALKTSLRHVSALEAVCNALYR